MVLEGLDRALLIASQAFTALIPALILVSTLASAGSRDPISAGIVQRFGLRGDAADAVEQLFDRPDTATGSLSLVSVLLVLLSGVSFTRRMQRMYQQAWDLPPVGVRGSPTAVLGLVMLLIEIVMLYGARALVRGLPLDRVIMVPVSALAGVALWTSVPWLLLDRRVHWKRLVPVGIVASVATSLYGVTTTVYMPSLIERYSGRYGLIGVTIALVGWLLCISLVIVMATVVGAEFDRTPDPWATRLRALLRITPPVADAVSEPTTSPANGRADARGSSVTGEVTGGENADRRDVLRRILVSWAIIAVALALAAWLVPDVDVKGGFFTLLWVAALFGLVNAILGPILHLISLPLTMITLGLFALVVNGVLLAITAGLSDNLDVGGFFGTVVAALIISVVAAVLGFLLRPARTA